MGFPKSNFSGMGFSVGNGFSWFCPGAICLARGIPESHCSESSFPKGGYSESFPERKCLVGRFPGKKKINKEFSNELFSVN